MKKQKINPLLVAEQTKKELNYQKRYKLYDDDFMTF